MATREQVDELVAKMKEQRSELLAAARSLSPEDANYYDTHGKDGVNLGPDEVSSHPLSTSPFGLDDMSGNAFEWVRSSLLPNELAIRGGCFFFDAVSARSSNRNVVEQGYRDPRFGLRVCASLPDP